MTASAEHEEHGPLYYVKIWAILLVLLIISIFGPMLGIQIVTVITAFGIAIVKALLVAAHFMHLNVEKKYIWYLLVSMLLMTFLFFMGVSPDVMEFNGNNWENISAKQYVDSSAMSHEEHGAEQH